MYRAMRRVQVLPKAYFGGVWAMSEHRDPITDDSRFGAFSAARFLVVYLVILGLLVWWLS